MNRIRIAGPALRALSVGIVTLGGLVGILGSASPQIAQNNNPVAAGAAPVGTGPRTHPEARVSIGRDGNGFAAYLSDGQVNVARFSGASGFAAPEAIARLDSSTYDEVDVAAAGPTAHVLWRNAEARIVRAAWSSTGGWGSAPVVLSEPGGGDPLVASDQHARGDFSPFLASWRQGVQLGQTPSTDAMGEYVSTGRIERISNYASGEDLNTPLFGLRVATGPGTSLAAWTAQRRSDMQSLIYVARRSDTWSVPRQIGAVTAASPTAVAVDVDGDGMVAWAADDGVYFSRYLRVTDSWTPATRFSQLGVSNQRVLRQVSLDLAPNGRAIVAWSREGGGIWAGEYDPITAQWLDLRAIDGADSATAGTGTDPVVGIDGVGRATIAWLDGDRARAIQHERSSGYSAIEELGAAQSLPDLDVNDAGLAVAVWWQDGLHSRVWNRAGAPSPSFVVTPLPGVVDQSLQFDARASTGPFPLVNYEWDWEDDGTYDSNAGAIAQHAYAAAGTYTARLRVTDSATQSATTFRSIVVRPPGAVTSRVTVNYAADNDAEIRILSTAPGAVATRCVLAGGVTLPTVRGSCSAEVASGYDVVVTAQLDRLRTTFSGWPVGPAQCDRVSSTTAPGGSTEDCRFAATSQDRSFDVQFGVAASVRPLLRVEMHASSTGSGSITSTPALVNCSAEIVNIVNASGGQCVYSTDAGATYTLLGTPPNYSTNRFVGWSGCDGTPSVRECVVTMSGSRTVTARFSAQ
jgi:PKD repeat protein